MSLYDRIFFESDEYHREKRQSKGRREDHFQKSDESHSRVGVKYHGDIKQLGKHRAADASLRIKAGLADASQAERKQQYINQIKDPAMERPKAGEPWPERSPRPKRKTEPPEGWKTLAAKRRAELIAQGRDFQSGYLGGPRDLPARPPWLYKGGKRFETQ